MPGISVAPRYQILLVNVDTIQGMLIDTGCNIRYQQLEVGRSHSSAGYMVHLWIRADNPAADRDNLILNCPPVSRRTVQTHAETRYRQFPPGRSRPESKSKVDVRVLGLVDLTRVHVKT